ncbi:MAG: DUF2325 domain-containing protein [Rhodocyclaceae bacterium]
MQADLQATQQDLMSAVIGHLGRLAQTGCPRASHRARLPIDHIGEGDTTVLSRLDDRSVLCLGRDASAARFVMRLVEMAGGRFTDDPPDDAEDLARIEQSVHAADLVICQAGCISQNAYWRVRDRWRRTGRPCLLVERPRAMPEVQR